MGYVGTHQVQTKGNHQKIFKVQDLSNLSDVRFGVTHSLSIYTLQIKTIKSSYLISRIVQVQFHKPQGMNLPLSISIKNQCSFFSIPKIKMTFKKGHRPLFKLCGHSAGSMQQKIEVLELQMLAGQLPNQPLYICVRTEHSCECIYARSQTVWNKVSNSNASLSVEQELLPLVNHSQPARLINQEIYTIAVDTLEFSLQDGWHTKVNLVGLQYPTITISYYPTRGSQIGAMIEISIRIKLYPRDRRIPGNNDNFWRGGLGISICQGPANSKSLIHFFFKFLCSKKQQILDDNVTAKMSLLYLQSL